MKNLVIAFLVLALGVAYYAGRQGGGSGSAAGDGAPGGAADQAAGRGGAGRGGGNGGFGGFGGRGGPRPPMTVETTQVARASIPNELLVVGNLIGDSTVSVVPRATGRLQEIGVRLGDRVQRGERIARIEDFELQEQVKQAEAAIEVSGATIRQREADLKLAETNVERSRNLFQRQLLPKQTLDDNEARYQSGLASLDLARAQHTQSKARLDELRINLGNTIIVSPVDGFVARRLVDPGAFVSQNQPIVDVVDIGRVRLVANVIEKDLTNLDIGNPASVEVDAFSGETFEGRIARMAPVLDPATRTAPIEIEIPNRAYRLRPGMYARVRISTDTTKSALVLPSDAVVDLGGRRGVFVPQNETAVFRVVQVGVEQKNRSEILAGLVEGDLVVTTGARALRDGDRIVLPGEAGGRGRREGGGRAGASAAAESNETVGPRPPGADAHRPNGRSGAPGDGGAIRADGARGRSGRGRRGVGSPDSAGSTTP